MTTSSIGTNSRNYSTIALWWAACPANLVTATQTWEGECYNDSEFALTTTLTLSGVTTSDTYYPELRCAAGHSFVDNANKLTNALRYNQANGVAIKQSVNWQPAMTLNNSYLRLTGLQIFINGNYTQYINLFAPTMILRNCIFQKRTNTYEIVNNTGATLINCVLMTAGNGPAVLAYNSASKLYNCTLISLGSSSLGINKVYGGADSSIVKNCAIFGFSTAMDPGSWGAGTDYNASDDDTLPAGTHNLTSLTFANQFQNVAGASTLDLRTKTGNSLVAGTRDQTNTNDLDIVGQARSTTTPTIGAWEYVVGFSFLPILQRKTNTLLRR